MKKTIIIKGMHCQGCKALIEDICLDYNKISKAHVDSKAETLNIEFEQGLNLQELKEEIESSGPYEVKI